MAASISIQFVGKDELLRGYDFADIDTWAIWQGSNLLLSGDGKEQLSQFLDMLKGSPGNCIYTLCLYTVAAESITKKTEPKVSYGFRLSPAAEQIGSFPNSRYGSAPGADPIMQALYRKYSDKIVGMIESDFEGKAEKDPTAWEIISGHLQNPDLPQHLPAIIGAIKNLFGSVPTMGNVVPMAPAAKVAGFVDTCTEADAVRLSIAIDQLEKADPKILEHLEKLAVLARDKPDVYKMALSFLK